MAHILYHYNSDIYTYIKNKVLEKPKPIPCKFCKEVNNGQCDNFCYDNTEAYLNKLVDSYGKPRNISEQIGNYTNIEGEMTYKELDYYISYLLLCKNCCDNCKYTTNEGCGIKVTIANALICRIFVKSDSCNNNECNNHPHTQDTPKYVKPRLYWDADYCILRETYVGVLPPNENTLLLETMLPTYRMRDYQKYENGYEMYAYQYDKKFYRNTRKL